MSEKFPQLLEYQPNETEVTQRQHEVLANNERLVEQSHNKPAERIEHIRHNIDRVAEKAERTQEQQKTLEQQPIHHHYVTKKIKADQYKITLASVRKNLPKSQQRFSSFVHQPVIEKISEVSAKTIARPSGILGGASFALFGSIFVLFVAHHIGFQVPNTIFIILFVIGFGAGILSELVLGSVGRLRPKNRRQKALYR